MTGVCFFADDLDLLASLNSTLHLPLEQFAAECEVAWLRISTSTSEAIVLSLRKVVLVPSGLRGISVPSRGV